MKNGICYVVGAGENYGLDFCPTTDDFVIAADAGLYYLEKQDIKADLVTGDFDTLKYIPKHPNVLALNTKKMTQMHLLLFVRVLKQGMLVFIFIAEQVDA